MKCWFSKNNITLLVQDRVYVHQSETTSVYDLGLILFKDEILHHSLVREHLRNTLLAMVAQERRGEIVDRYGYVHNS